MRATALSRYTILVAGIIGLVAVGTVLLLNAIRTGSPALDRSREPTKNLAQTTLDIVASKPEAKETIVAKSRQKKPVPVNPVDSGSFKGTLPAQATDARLLHGLNDVPISSHEAGANRPSSANPTSNDSRPKAFDSNAKGREILPWGLIEPVPLTPTEEDRGDKDIRAATPTAVSALRLKQLPEGHEVEAWLKVKSTQIDGPSKNITTLIAAKTLMAGIIKKRKRWRTLS
jgi:hypothetical protein